MLESQLKTPNLSHPPELQVPLFLQPRGTPPELEQFVHPIVQNFAVKLQKIKLQK
jgi:hypothetical protein